MLTSVAKSFRKICNDHGLDPKKTSLHAAECIALGLDPAKTSIRDLERTKGK